MEKENAIKTIRAAAAKASGNFRKYSYRICDAMKSGESMMGAVDYKPMEGNVIHLENGVMVIQEGRKAVFAAFDMDNLSTVPEVGDKVLVTPYQRRRFDGKFLTDPVEETILDSGFKSTVYHLGEQVSKIPGIDQNHSIELRQMADQLESIKVDSRRRITQFLIDCGASAYPVELVDVDSEPDNYMLPKITFGFNSQGCKGQLSVTLNRAADSYTVTAKEDGKDAVVIEDLYFDQLAETIVEVVPHSDDWMIDKVQILKKAGKKKAG